jgi:glycolate dehydrogenase FAD-binding subunit
MIAADTAAEVCEAVRSAARIVPVAGRTKPGLWQSEAATELELGGLRGIVDYDPAELTFTAEAGTPVAEVVDALSEHGQYLPFDPPLVGAGATLGGVVAAATSGPGAFRHGSVRDFVIGAQIVDGTGRLINSGGRVVKNAAGFDLPKLMIGSLGRLGVMVRLSFKVFPRPRATTTLVLEPASPAEALRAMSTVARGPLQADALDLTADGRLLVQLGGAPEVIDARAVRCAQLLGDGAVRLSEDLETAEWESAKTFAWLPEAAELVRVALSPSHVLALNDALGGSHDTPALRLSLAGNLAWIGWPRARPIAELDAALRGLGLRGARLTGSAEPCSSGPLLGDPAGGAFGERLGAALDPDHRFLGL